MLTLEQMTPEQKLGRVLCFRGLHDPDNIEFALEMLKNDACGPIQVTTYATNLRPDLIKTIREAANYPVLIVEDMEVGYPKSKLPKIPLGTLAASNNPEYAKMFAAALAKEAKEAGYNGIWGPIIDIARNGNARIAGDTPETVLNTTREIYKTFASYRFQSCGKHYPGGWSDKPIDSHMAAPHSDQTKEDLLRNGIAPYKMLMDEGLLPSIMVGHRIFDKIDPGIPASLSKKVMDIIRELGYDGVIYSDSYAMISILQTFGEKQAYAMGLMAGVDVILPNYRTPMRKVYEMMLESYREGAITDERLDEAVRRIMALEQYCAQEPVDPVPVPENVGEILSMVAKDCITADCDEGLSPAIGTEKERLFVVLTPMDYSGEMVNEEVETVVHYSAKKSIDAIKELFPNCGIELIPEYPKPRDNDRVLTAATRYDEVVFVSFCESAPYMGSDGLTRRIETVINALTLPGKLTALVHFGNPLAVKNLWHIPRKIFGYNATASQPYAFEVLAGKYPAKGKNPYASLYKKMSASE